MKQPTTAAEVKALSALEIRKLAKKLDVPNHTKTSVNELRLILEEAHS